jgi:hypothetical protein
MNNNCALANNVYDNNDGELIDASLDLENSVPEHLDLARRGVWSRLFPNENVQPRVNSRSHQSPTSVGYALSNGRFHYVPFGKRTIPIELQKALYAHGIVGRRR